MDITQYDKVPRPLIVRVFKGTGVMIDDLETTEEVWGPGNVFEAKRFVATLSGCSITVLRESNGDLVFASDKDGVVLTTWSVFLNGHANVWSTSNEAGPHLCHSFEDQVITDPLVYRMFKRLYQAMRDCQATIPPTVVSFLHRTEV